MTLQTKVNHEPEVHVCSICGTDYAGWGHNAEPVNDGRCCDNCNNIVIVKRLNNMRRAKK